MDWADEKVPESKPLNASPPPIALDGPPLVAFCIGRGALDPVEGGCAGVVDRDAFEEDEPVAASIENTSFWGLFACIGNVVVAIAPSLRGGSAGLGTPVEFQRSANASDMLVILGV